MGVIELWKNCAATLPIVQMRKLRLRKGGAVTWNEWRPVIYQRFGTGMIEPGTPSSQPLAAHV